MEDNEDTEVPLSNYEVLRVLKARENNSDPDSKCTEMIKYLESVIKKDKYPLEKLRDLKINDGLDASLNTLAILSNTQDLSILSASDKKRIVKALG